MSLFKSQTKLLMGLIGGSTAYAPPFHIQLDLTNQCNFSCLNCRFHSPALKGPKPIPASLDFNLILRLAEELDPRQTRDITLVGSGEPLLYPGIIETVAIFKRKGFTISLYTNGSMLNSELSGALLRAGLDTLFISLWASSPEQYAANYPGSSLNNYFLVLENMQTISEMKKSRQLSKPMVYWQHPINRHNCSSLDVLAATVKRTGCDGISFSPLNTPWGKHKGSALAKSSLDTLKAELKDLSFRLDSTGLKHNIPGTLLCYALREGDPADCCYAAWVRGRIHVDGSLSSCRCQRIPFGNLHEKIFAELWNGPEIRHFRNVARSRSGMLSLMNGYECNNCCFSVTNRKIHRHYTLFTLPARITQMLLHREP
jgi:MoaA/NifB/PqqE/SkfB family radical SAM enzyme